jgi:phage terminase Nu1 subunit (DNA packaging protein)
MSMIPVADQIQSGWLNKTAMAASLGISTQALDKWGVRPVAKVGRSVYFTVADVLANRFQNVASKQQPEYPEDEENGCGYDYERYRLTKAQADNMEIKNELAKGKAAPVNILQMCLSKVAGEVAGLLDGIPLDVKRKDPNLDSQSIENIKRICVKAQNAMSKIDDILDQVLNDYLADLDAD